MSDLIVLDIGGTHVRFGHVCAKQALYPGVQRLSSDRLRVPHARAALASSINDYVTANGLRPAAIVLGVPGRLDKQHDALTLCNNIRQLEGEGLAASLQILIGCPVLLEQDIMLQLLGEWLVGSGQGCEALFGVYFGTGIGAAYLQQGDPDRRGGYTLQAGHIPVASNGRPCVCGNLDCAEAYACGHTLAALAAQTECPLERLFIERDRADLAGPLDEFLRYQAYMVASSITLLEPDNVLIGGGIADMPGYPRIEIVQRIRRHLQKPWPAESLPIGFTSLGIEASLQGGLALMQRLDDRLA